MGSSIVVESTVGQGAVFTFQVTFDLFFAPEDRDRDPHHLHTAPSKLPSGEQLAAAHQSKSVPLRFLVVDDNALNKTLFERTVNNMFIKENRVRPVYTFAANGNIFS
jgi:hypothetical protein